jgi:hypothetical protein
MHRVVIAGTYLLKRALFMKDIPGKFQFFVTGRHKPVKSSRRKSRGQSMVEIAIAFPVLIILFSGMIEFGFVLNYYLSLLDGTREAARYYSNGTPFEYGKTIGNCQCPNGDTDPCPDETDADTADVDCDRPGFYSDTAAMVLSSIQPTDANDTSRKIVLDPARDDVIVTVVGVDGSTITRYMGGTGVYRQYLNHVSPFDDTRIQSLLITDAPCTGILIVEVFYNYDSVLKLPWLEPLFPALLHAYTIMPLIAAEPVC